MKISNPQVYDLTDVDGTVSLSFHLDEGLIKLSSISKKSTKGVPINVTEVTLNGDYFELMTILGLLTLEVTKFVDAEWLKSWSTTTVVVSTRPRT